MKRLTGDGFRFVVVGVINMLLSTSLYQMFLFVMPPNFAYAFIWVIGITFVAIVYPAVVFAGVRHSRRNFAVTVVVYLCSFLLGSMVIALAESSYPENRQSIFAALILTTIFNFVAMRFFLQREDYGKTAPKQK
jgi:hypothetical protein